MEQNRCRSAPQQPIQADPSEYTDRDGGRPDVGELAAGVHERHDEQRAQTPGERCEGYLSRDSGPPTRAAMVIGEVTVAAWTGRHSEREERRGQ